MFRINLIDQKSSLVKILLTSFPFHHFIPGLNLYSFFDYFVALSGTFPLAIVVGV
jgi:hypothetical protein